MTTISKDNKLATILDFDVCKELVEKAKAKGEDTCVILCPHYSINVQSKYEDGRNSDRRWKGEQLDWDLDELNKYINAFVEVSDYDDLVVNLTYCPE